MWSMKYFFTYNLTCTSSTGTKDGLLHHCHEKLRPDQQLSGNGQPDYSSSDDYDIETFTTRCGYRVPSRQGNRFDSISESYRLGRYQFRAQKQASAATKQSFWIWDDAVFWRNGIWVWAAERWGWSHFSLSIARLFLSQSHLVLFFFSLSHNRTCGFDQDF